VPVSRLNDTNFPKLFAIAPKDDILPKLIRNIKKRMRLSPVGFNCRVKSRRKFLRAKRVVRIALNFLKKSLEVV